MVGNTDRYRGYLMALSASKAFGHSSKPAHALAGRIAEIGATRGLTAAAEELNRILPGPPEWLSGAAQRQSSPGLRWIIIANERAPPVPVAPSARAISRRLETGYGPIRRGASCPTQDRRRSSVITRFGIVIAGVSGT